MKTAHFLVLALFISYASSKISVNSLYEKPERQQLMKNYAFCKCLEYSLGEKITKDINAIDASKSVLYDIANLWGSRHTPLDSIALLEVNKVPMGQTADHEAAKPYILKCLEFYRSKELDIFVKSLE